MVNIVGVRDTIGAGDPDYGIVTLNAVKSL